MTQSPACLYLAEDLSFTVVYGDRPREQVWIPSGHYRYIRGPHPWRNDGPEWLFLHDPHTLEDIRVGCAIGYMEWLAEEGVLLLQHEGPPHE